MTLRLQNERMSGSAAASHPEFAKSFGLTNERLQWAKPDAIVDAPRPGEPWREIDSAVLDGPRQLVLQPR